MAEGINCFLHAGRSDLDKKFKDHLDAGIPEKEAARKVILEEHERLHNELNDLRKKVNPKSKSEPYIPPSNEEAIKKINEEYDKKIATLPQQTETEKPIDTEVDKTGEGAGEKPPEGGAEVTGETAGEPRTVGASHESLRKTADRMGLKQPERGTFLTPKEQTQRGRKLLEGGADPEKVAADFREDGKVGPDEISVARAHFENLTKEAQDTMDKYGKNSPEYAKAKLEIQKWQDDILKPMGTASGASFSSLQGETDLDTGSFVAVSHALKEETGNEPSKEQEEKIKELTDRNKQLQEQADKFEQRLIEETDKAFKEGKESVETSVKQKAKKLAQRLRKAAKIHKPGMFSAASPASLAWDGAVEVVAKGIEAGGTIAQAISDGIAHLKNTAWYKSLTKDDKDKAEKEFSNWHNQQLSKTGNGLEDLQKQFIDKSDSKFSIEEAKDIWDYAKKNYLDKGVSYRDMIAKVSNDLGLSWKQVSEAITSKKVQRISDEMWKKQSDYRRSQMATKNWVEAQNKSVPFKALRKVSAAFRGVAVFGHGGIFIGTHAGMTLFNPSQWRIVVPAFIRGWKFAYGNRANYERRIEQLRNSPNYVLAQRAGLKNNPDVINTEEFQKSQEFFKKIGGEAGIKGFNAIKVLRQDLFDYHYNRLSEVEKSDPEAIAQIARLVNNATGATNLKLPKWVDEVSFAGGMEAARWGKLTRNPLRATAVAMKALLKPESATTSERVFAKVWARRVGEQLGTMTSLLIANAAIQNALNPKNPVNLTNPNKPDFLKFKFGDLTIDPTSGMRGAAMFAYGVGKIPLMTKKELRGDTRIQAFGKNAVGYVRGKTAPFYSTLADFFAQQDYNKNPLPFSEDKPGIGHHKLTWGEYAWEKAPLPLAHAAQDMYHSALDNGGDKLTVTHVLDGIISGVLSGGTGFRVGEYDAEEANHSPFTEADKKELAFKYFLDKGMELPNTALASEKVKDEKTHTTNLVSEYPKEIQEKYSKAHTKYLKEALQDVIDNRTVYVSLYGEVKLKQPTKEEHDEQYDEVELNKLTKDQLAQVLHLAQSQATKKTKDEIFYDK